MHVWARRLRWAATVAAVPFACLAVWRADERAALGRSLALVARWAPVE
jgi:hypothetical protein